MGGGFGRDWFCLGQAAVGYINNEVDMTQAHAEIQNLLQCVDGRARRVAFFGSSIRRGVSQASDIDVLVFVDPAEFQSVRECICSLNPKAEINVERAMCSYTVLPEIDKKLPRRTDKPIHVAFLPNDPSQYEPTELWQRNRDSLRYL